MPTGTPVMPKHPCATCLRSQNIHEPKTFMETKCLYQNVSCRNARLPCTYLDIVIWILGILNWNATSNQLWLPSAKCFDMLSAKITRQKSVFEIWRQIIYLQNEYPQNKIPLYIFANPSIGISSFPIIKSQQSKNMKVSSENIKWKHSLSDKWKTRTNGIHSMIASSQTH